MHGSKAGKIPIFTNNQFYLLWQTFGCHFYKNTTNFPIISTKIMVKTRRRASGFLKDFQDFALKGNVVDLAIAVIIGGAFGKIVSSFVEDVVMPLINPLVSAGGKDWRTITVGTGIAIGKFLGSIVDFVIIALVLFVVIQALQKFKKKEEIAAEPPPAEPNLVAQERLTDALDRLTQTLESRNPQV
jgi:large conductance mechanosensitive channel